MRLLRVEGKRDLYDTLKMVKAVCFVSYGFRLRKFENLRIRLSEL